MKGGGDSAPHRRSHGADCGRGRIHGGIHALKRYSRKWSPAPLSKALIRQRFFSRGALSGLGRNRGRLPPHTEAVCDTPRCEIHAQRLAIGRHEIQTIALDGGRRAHAPVLDLAVRLAANGPPQLASRLLVQTEQDVLAAIFGADEYPPLAHGRAATGDVTEFGRPLDVLRGTGIRFAVPERIPLRQSLLRLGSPVER